VFGVLDHEDGVGAVGNGGSGHDFAEFASVEGCCGDLSGAELGGEEEELMGIGVGGAAGEAVAGGAWEGWVIAVGEEREGEDTARCGCQRDDFRLRRVLALGVICGQGSNEELNLLGGFGVRDGRGRHGSIVERSQL
jgi:hypothetical protein